MMELSHASASRMRQSLVAGLNQQFQHRSAEDVLETALTSLGRSALVTSFGAESAVLLHLVAKVDRTATIFFIDTELLFPETLDYQQTLCAHLGLTGVVILRAAQSGREDPDNSLHQRDPDACCSLRKTAPLHAALRGLDAWVSGRKRFQSGTRAGLDLFELEDSSNRIKVNPLAHWSAPEIAAYFDTHDLPRHPLLARGYLSVGCAPCTSPVATGEDPRAGRWRGQDKTECGIHFSSDGRAVRTGAPT